MSNGILLFVEQRDQILAKTSLEALVAAQMLTANLNQSLTAVVLVQGISKVAEEMAGKIEAIVKPVFLGASHLKNEAAASRTKNKH